MLAGGDRSREKRLEAIVRIFERSFNPRAAGFCRTASMRIGALEKANEA